MKRKHKKHKRRKSLSAENERLKREVIEIHKALFPLINPIEPYTGKIRDYRLALTKIAFLGTRREYYEEQMDKMSAFNDDLVRQIHKLRKPADKNPNTEIKDRKKEVLKSMENFFK